MTPPDSTTAAEQSSTTSLRELATLGPAVAALAALLLVIATGDAYPREVVTGVAGIAVLQVLPGVLLWRSVRPVDGWLVEDLVMGLALGAALAVPVQIVTAAADLRLLAFVLPLALAAALLATPATRDRIATRQVGSLPWWWGAALLPTIATGVTAFLSSLQYPVRWTGYANQYVDRGFHQGLVDEALHRFPPHYPYVADEAVSYHWFSHAWNAHVATVADLPPDVTLYLLTPALIAIAGPVLLAVVGLRLTGRPWIGIFAGVVGYLANQLQPWLTTRSWSPFGFESPSQQFALLIYPALLAVIGLRWQDRVPRRASTVVLLLLMLVAAGTKGTTLSVLVPAMLLATVAMALFDRSRLRVVATDAAITLVAFVFTTVVVFGGETKNLEVKPFEWMATTSGEDFGLVDPEPWSAHGLALVALWLVGVCLAGAAVFAALALRDGRRDPVLWLLTGCTCSGIGALVVFVQLAESHVYFHKVAILPFGLAVGVGLGHLADRVRRPGRLALAGLGTGLLTAGILAVVGSTQDDPGELTAWATTAVLVAVVLVVAWQVAPRLDPGPGAGLVGATLVATVGLIAAGIVGPAVSLSKYDRPNRAVTERAATPILIFAGDVRALRWLERNSEPDDLAATNRHCRGLVEEGCDRRAFQFSAYSERRFLVEGWGYTPLADAQYDPATGSRWKDFWDTELITENDRFFSDPDEAGRDALLDRGVRWLVLDTRVPEAAETLEPWATLRRTSRNLRIYELTR